MFFCSNAIIENKFQNSIFRVRNVTIIASQLIVNYDKNVNRVKCEIHSYSHLIKLIRERKMLEFASNSTNLKTIFICNQRFSLLNFDKRLKQSRLNKTCQDLLKFDKFDFSKRQNLIDSSHMI